MRIATFTESYWEQVRQIYLDGISSTNSTFETDAPDWPRWNSAHLTHSRFVALNGEHVAGWAALTPVSGRCVYQGVAEVSVYVSKNEQRKGVGRILLNTLIESSERHGLWTLQAGIMVENTASIELHKQCGFRVIGTRERIGKLKGVWRSTVLLERRSTVAGID